MTCAHAQSDPALAPPPSALTPATPGAAAPKKPALAKPVPAKTAPLKTVPAKPVPAKAASGAPGAGATRIPAPGPAEKPLLFGNREFEDPRSGLELTVPAGWFVVEVPKLQPGDISMMILDGPGLPPPQCRAGVRTPKQPAKITQAMLNKVMHDERNIKNIRTNLGQNNRVVQGVSKITQDGVNGLRGQVVIAGNAQRPDLTMVVSFFETPGRTYTFECSVLTADYGSMGPDIDSIIKSVRFAKN